MSLVFEAVFLDGCNITDGVYREWAGGRGMGGGTGGWEVEGLLKQTLKHKWQCCAVSR